MVVGRQPRLVWHLRSTGDGDTHHGVYSIATRSVHAACGVEFVPHSAKASPRQTPPMASPCPRPTTIESRRADRLSSPRRDAAPKHSAQESGLSGAFRAAG
jgi:hypothetical protein